MSLPEAARLIQIATVFSELCGRLASEVGPARLVLPDSNHFPDLFTQDARSVQRLIERLQVHAGITDIPVEAVVYDDEDGSATSGCGGSCAPRTHANAPGRVTLSQEADRDGWQVNLLRSELGHATALTTLLGRSLAQVLLEEVREENSRGIPQTPELIELTALRLGYGPLLLEGSHVYSKGCAGPQIHHLTKLDTGELAFSLALLAQAFSLRLGPVYSHLSTTQSSLLREAEQLVEANSQLGDWVRAGKPGTAFSLSAPRSRLAAWLSGKRDTENETFSESLLASAQAKLLTTNLDASRGESTSKHPANASKPRSAADEQLKEWVEEALQGR
jgi:hypothetical protein